MASRKRTDLVSSWGNDSIHCDTICSAEDTFYIGCDDEDYENPSIRRQRLALAGQRFLDGSVPFILTSTLKGPFNKSSGWKNPWTKQRNHQSTSPITTLADPVSPVPAKKYTRTSKDKRIAKEHQEDAECYLPSPESLKQESITEAGHPFLDDDELDAVRSWRDNVASSPVILDDPWASKQTPSSRNWLKTNIRKRKFDEYSPPAPKSLTSSRRHQFSDNIAANKPRAAPQLKTFSSAPAQLNAQGRCYRSPTSSSTKGPQHHPQIKEHATTRKPQRPASESEDELSQDQQAATLSSPVSLKLHKTTLIKQNSSPLKTPVQLNSPRNKTKTPPPILCVSPNKSTQLVSAEASKEHTVKLDEDQSNEAIQEISHLDGTSPHHLPETIPVTKNDASMGESSDTCQSEESGDDIEYNAELQIEQATASSAQSPPSTHQHVNGEIPTTHEIVPQVEMSTGVAVGARPSDTAQDDIGISDDEQDMLSDATSDELSEVASDDIPSSVCREIAAQLRSDAASYEEEDTQSVGILDNAADEENSQTSSMDSVEDLMEVTEDSSSLQPATLPPLPHIDEAEESNISVAEAQDDCKEEENASLGSSTSLSICSPISASDQPISEQVLDVTEEQTVLETVEDAVATELVNIPPEQDTAQTFQGATTPEVEMKDVDDVAVTQINTPSQENPSEFSLRNVIQRLVPSSPWACLSQVASLALAIPQEVTAGDSVNDTICGQEQAEAEVEQAPLRAHESPIAELQEVSLAVTATSDAVTVTGTESISRDVESYVKGEVVKRLDMPYHADGPTETETCATPANDLVHTPTVVVDATGNEEMRTEVKAAPENETTVLQSIEVAAPVTTNTSRCVSPENDSPASQPMIEMTASSGSVDGALPSNDSKCSPTQPPLNEDTFTRSTPEPKFSFASFASFASPIQRRPAKKQLYNSKRGSKRGILRRRFDESRQRKAVTWSAVLERTEDSETDVSRGLRELSPPPAAALGELPTANDDKFNKHFSAVVKRTDGLRHKLRSYSKSQRAEVREDDEQGDNQEDVPMTSTPQVPDSAVDDFTDTQEREASEEPMDIVEDLLTEMGDFLQVFDIDTELVQARKESAAKLTAA